jgi:hypothetical protein
MIQGLQVVVDWDTADAVLEAHLLHTYHELTDQIKRFKSKKKLKDYEHEDLEQFERVIDAIEVIGSWYIFDFDKKKKKKK